MGEGGSLYMQHISFMIEKCKSIIQQQGNLVRLFISKNSLMKGYVGQAASASEPTEGTPPFHHNQRLENLHSTLSYTSPSTARAKQYM